MIAWLQRVAEVVMVLWALIQIVERPGEGAQKKAQVKQKFLEWLELVRPTLPGWLYLFLTQGPFLDFVIDTIVWAANQFGFFSRSEPQPSGSSSAS